MASMIATRDVCYFQRKVNENELLSYLGCDPLRSTRARRPLDHRYDFTGETVRACFRPTDERPALSFQPRRHLSLQIICLINENQKQHGVFCA